MSPSAPNLRTQADATAEDLHDLLREAEFALGDADIEATDYIVALRERLRGAIAGSKAAVQHLAASARRQAALADETIREHPYAAIGIAAGVGLLVGHLIASRRCCPRR